MKKGFLWAGKNAFLGARTIWDKNLGADVHSKLGSTRAEVPIGVFFHELHHPSTQKPESRPPILTHQNQVGGHDARGWLDDRYNRLHPQWKTACKQDKSCPHRKEKQGLRLCWQQALQVWFPSVYSWSVYLAKRVNLCWRKSMRVHVETMLHQGLWSGKHSDLYSIGFRSGRR